MGGKLRDKELALQDYNRMIKESETILSKLIETSNNFLKSLEGETNKLKAKNDKKWIYLTTHFFLNFYRFIWIYFGGLVSYPNDLCLDRYLSFIIDISDIVSCINFVNYSAFIEKLLYFLGYNDLLSSLGSVCLLTLNLV